MKKHNTLYTVLTLFVLVLMVSGIAPTGTMNATQNEGVDVAPVNLNTPATTIAIDADNVDATESQTYGTTTAGPPSGMGSDTGYSTLQESSYVVDGLEDETTQSFSSSLSPWTTYMDLYRDSFEWQSTGGQSGGWAGIVSAGREDEGGGLRSESFYVGSAQTEIDITWYYLKDPTFRDSYVKVRDENMNWDTVITIPEEYDTQSAWMNNEAYARFTTTDEQYFHEDFAIEFENGDCSDGSRFGIDTVVVTITYEETYYRFEAVYRFDNLDDDHVVKSFRGWFNSGSSEGLHFYGGPTSNPTTLLRYNTYYSFFEWISEYCEGGTYYIKIIDKDRDGDTDQDTWYITRLFITTYNTFSEAVSAECTNLDDGDNLYNNSKVYSFTSVVSDVDGWENIDSVQLNSYDYHLTTLRFSLTWDHENGFNYWYAGGATLDCENSSIVTDGNTITITWLVTIDDSYGSHNDDDIYLAVQDGACGDGLFTDSNYDYIMV